LVDSYKRSKAKWKDAGICGCLYSFQLSQVFFFPMIWEIFLLPWWILENIPNFNHCFLNYNRGQINTNTISYSNTIPYSVTPRNIGQIISFWIDLLPVNLGKTWTRHRPFFLFPTHLLHFSQWRKKFDKCGDLIWDRTNQDHLYESMATSTKIKYQSLPYYVIYERSFNIYVIKIV
jgi:hypothetical protein